MNGIAIVKRYTEGFLDFADETIGRKIALEELQSIQGILRDNPDFAHFLDGRQITYEEKCATVESIFQKWFSVEIRDFIKLLLKKNRFDRFGMIAEYAQRKYSHVELLDAVLETRYPISKETAETVKRELEKRLKKRLDIHVSLDPQLLGGLRVAIGNIVIDGSVRRRIDDLKFKLMTAKVA